MIRTRLFAAVPLMLAAAACAPRATTVSANQPRLVGCPENLSDARTARNVRYTVIVRVDAMGRVIPGSAQVQPRPGRVLRSAAGEQEARTRAESCSFTPAMRDGMAVESRTIIPVVITI
jgi:hypothetical protein